jgi:hypothetical protein
MTKRRAYRDDWELPGTLGALPWREVLYPRPISGPVVNRDLNSDEMLALMQAVQRRAVEVNTRLLDPETVY